MASGPYAQAYDHVALTRNFVTSTLAGQLNYANSIRSQLQGTLDQLANFNPTLNFTGQVPQAPVFDANITGNFNLPGVGPTSFGSVSGITASLGNLGPIRQLEDIDISPFVPSVASLTIPDAPTMTAPLDGPEKPELDAVVVPGAPQIDKPAFPSLATITIPEFDFPTLPQWDASAPEFEGTPVSTVLQWGNPQYSTEVMDEVVGKLRDIWAGGNGIPPAVEQAMWERAAGREDIEVSRQISAAYTEFSSRGFTAPPGMLTARVDAIQEEASIRKQGASREIAIRMAELQVENMRFAVEQGVAAENVLFNIWNNIAQRQFEAAKIELDSQLALYNANVALFNARQQAYATEAQVFKVRLDAELAQIEVFKARLEGELARGQLNEQRVRIYGEQIRALLADVEVYKAVMQGASIQSDVNKTQIDGFRAEVQAYAERINADKVRFDAFDSQVRGELGKAQIMDSEARAYASYVSGQSTVATIGIKQLEADIARNEQVIREFTARLEADKAKIQADVAKIQAQASAYTADTQRYSAQASAEEARHKVSIAAKESEIRATIGVFEVETRKYIADMEQVIRKAQVQLEALKSAGQVGSTLAAGAMAGINIGASLSGSGAVNAGGSYGESRTVSKSNSTNYSSSLELESGSPAPNSDW